MVESNCVKDGQVQEDPQIQQEKPRPITMQEEERDELPELTQQQELNDILEEFYDMVGEQGMFEYQRMVEGISQERLSENAVKAPDSAPDFELVDQDGDSVHLKDLLKKGPVILAFYRGKWCPHCHLQIMRLHQKIEDIQAKGATLVAISPMLPDGTQFMASKHSLQFPVVSDLGNNVARKFKIVFAVPSNMHENMKNWGENLPENNGDESWEIPLPATYIINQDGKIVWSFVDNDPGSRAEPEDIVAAIPTSDTCEDGVCGVNTDSRNRKSDGTVDTVDSTACTFGRNGKVKRRGLLNKIRRKFMGTQ